MAAVLEAIAASGCVSTASVGKPCRRRQCGQRDGGTCGGSERPHPGQWVGSSGFTVGWLVVCICPYFKKRAEK
jgi:hypothetical protein